MDLDHSLYPDTAPPSGPLSIEEKADYLDRVCAAFDHGVVPEDETLRELRTWKDVFDRFPVSGSSAYHALRACYGWEAVEQAPFFQQPVYLKFDRLEGRSDSCEDLL